MRGRAYVGPGCRAFEVSERSLVAKSMTSEDVLGHLSDALARLVRSLPAEMRREAERLEVVPRALEAEATSAKGYECRVGPGDPTTEDVRLARTHLQGQVISLIDKSRGEMAVM